MQGGEARRDGSICASMRWKERSTPTGPSLPLFPSFTPLETLLEHRSLPSLHAIFDYENFKALVIVDESSQPGTSATSLIKFYANPCVTPTSSKRFV
ncbi:hypothetical protein BDQ12DRAFT_683453, partial [Crucibulum laeve]